MAAAGAALAAATGLTLVAQADAPAPLQTAPQAVTDEYARPTPKGLPKQITLYQYEVCPFCCKVKAALDYYKLPYKVVEVNPLTKGELKWSSYKKVPVVKLDDEVVIGSSAIISRVAAEVDAARSGGSGSATDSSSSRSTSGTGTGGWGMFGASKPSVGSSGVSAEDETKWRKWVDDWFVKLLTANIYRSWDESWNTFSYITKQTNWSWGTREVARMSGAVLMWQVGKNMPKKYGVQGDLREALYKACDEFVDAVGPNRPFLGGAQPNLADLAVYGVLRAVRETPAFTDAMQHSQIEPWYKRAEAVIGDNSRTSTEGSVQWAVTN